MSIEWFRDLVVCIFGISATVVVLFLALLAFMCYRRVRPIIDSVKTTTRTVEDLTSTVEELVSPLGRVAAFVQGMRQAIRFFSGSGKKKEDK
jgi:hypothetical protein